MNYGKLRLSVFSLRFIFECVLYVYHWSCGLISVTFSWSMPSGVKADRLKFEHSAGIGDNLVSTLILSDDRLSDFRDFLENIDVQNTLIF